MKIWLLIWAVCVALLFFGEPKIALAIFGSWMVGRAITIEENMRVLIAWKNDERERRAIAEYSGQGVTVGAIYKSVHTNFYVRILCVAERNVDNGPIVVASVRGQNKIINVPWETFITSYAKADAKEVPAWAL